MKKKYLMYLLAFFIFFGTTVMFISSTIKNDETVTFFPTYAYYAEDGVVINIHAWIYEMEEGSILRKTLLKTIELSDKEFKNNPLFKKRMRYFLVDNERNKKINIVIAKQNIQLPLTKANGHTTHQIIIKKELLIDQINNRILSYKTKEQKNDDINFAGKVHIFSPEGISVISDIDDTIKNSNVLDKKELMKNTFSRNFTAIEGMSETYQRWSEKGVQFHYVSGSPWQLYPEIEIFFNKEGFPMGSFHLKYFRVKDSSILKFLKSDQLGYKTKIIENILKDFPKRKYILVGDSGEKDAEVYVKIAQKYPEQVIAVCIRDAGKSNDTAENYQSLFSEIKCKWIFFKEASELESIDKIIK